MNSRLGFVKMTTLAAVCAAAVGIVPLAQADSFSIGYHTGWHGRHHSHYRIAIGPGSGFYGGRYDPGFYAPVYFARGRDYYSGGPYYGRDDDYYWRRGDG